MPICPCITFSHTASGGISLSGSADSVLVKIGEGTVLLGGSAIVDSNHPFDGMEAVWFLDEDSTGDTDDFIDQSPHEYHGTGGDGKIIYTPVQVDGINCMSAQFFEVDDWINLPKDKLISSQPFSVSCWVKIDGQFLQRVFYSRGFQTVSDSWVFVLGHSYINHLWARLQMNDETIHYCFSSQTLNQNVWYHVAATWHPETGLKTFINGNADGTNSNAIGETASLSNGGYHGRWGNGGFYHGTLQDVRLHPVERNEAWFAAERTNYCGDFYTVSQTESAVFD